jgi:hypothetical protein
MWLVYLVCTVLAAIRIGGDKSEIFQAVAHVWVGALIGVWWIGCRLGYLDESTTVEIEGRISGRLVIALSVVEVVCFVVSRISP